MYRPGAATGADDRRDLAVLPKRSQLGEAPLWCAGREASAFVDALRHSNAEAQGLELGHSSREDSRVEGGGRRGDADQVARAERSWPQPAHSRPRTAPPSIGIVAPVT